MRRFLNRLPATIVLLAGLTSLGNLGCGQPVREDRLINWSQEGKAVGFQHGQEGVFLADEQGGKLRKIFQPGDDVLATSTPLWSPTGGKVIFTTARDTANATFPNQAWRSTDDPAGNVHLQRPIVYTCWLQEEAGEKSPAQPVPLFEAACDHVGYVAANLAVRWHPRAQELYYVKKIGEQQHALFAYDLTTKQSQQKFGQTGEALIFDWTPDGSNLVCVLGNSQPKPDAGGIWIGQPDAKTWWHVPQSEELAEGSLHSLLEQLRATRPAWTTDGSRFAFATCTPGKTKGQPGRFFLRLGTLATRKVEIVAEGAESFRDMRWAVDGQQLGVVIGHEAGSLHLLWPGEALSKPINSRPVRHFAGWNKAGNRLAYVVPDAIPLSGDGVWAFLLLPDPLARDTVYVADGAGKEPGKEVFSGMRVTFPQWSPKEDKLSLWATFAPTFRSVLSQLLGWGLRRGDPAAVFEPATGKISWMAVNLHEQAQVGNYYLLKRDFAESLRWYEKAELGLPPAKTETARNLFDVLRDPPGTRDFRIFESYCLKKLGRKDEALARLRQFNDGFFPKFVPDQPNAPPGGKAPAVSVKINGKTPEEWLQEWLDQKAFVGALVRGLYQAEVFLSLDAANDADEFFRDSLASAEIEPIRLSNALVLAQILLLQQKFQAYADLTTDTIAPLLFRPEPSRPAGQGQEFFDLQWVIDLTSMLALLPMCSHEFLAKLPDAKMQTLITRWKAFRPKATTDRQRYQIDLVLGAAYQRLGREKERQEVTERLKSNPSGSQGFFPYPDVKEMIKAFRQDWK